LSIGVSAEPSRAIANGGRIRSSLIVRLLVNDAPWFKPLQR
jgi:hypothetical protein